MRVLRNLAIFVLVSLVSAGVSNDRASAQAPAAQAEALAAATELFGFFSKDMLTQMAQQMTGQLWPLIDKDLPAGLDAKGRGELRAEFERIQMANLTEVLKDGPPIYARHFTAQELREMIAFYR